MMFSKCSRQSNKLQQPPKQNAKATKNQAQQQEKLKEIDIEDFDADNTELPF